MGIETALAAAAIGGTAASLKGQYDARKDAKSQNKKNRKDAILSEIMSIVSGQGPQGISPQYSTPPPVDYGGALSNLAMMGYGMHRDRIGDKQAADSMALRQKVADASIAADAARTANTNLQTAQSMGMFRPMGSTSILESVPSAPSAATVGEILTMDPLHMTPEQFEMRAKLELDDAGVLYNAEKARAAATPPPPPAPEPTQKGWLESFFASPSQSPQLDAPVVSNVYDIWPSERYGAVPEHMPIQTNMPAGWTVTMPAASASSVGSSPMDILETIRRRRETSQSYVNQYLMPRDLIPYP